MKTNSYTQTIEGRNYTVKNLNPDKTKTDSSKSEKQKLSEKLYDIFVKYEKSHK